MSDPSACPICGGDGYEIVDKAKWIVRECSCLQAKRDRERIKASGLEGQLERMKFKTFKAENPFQAEMLRVVTSWTKETLAGSNPWLYVGGAVGCGKTHLCTAACGMLLNQRRGVRYMLWTQHSRELRATINNLDVFDDLIYPWIHADVLYIDDLFKVKNGENGTADITPAELKVAFELLDSRYRQKKPTIISSEWFLAELIAQDEATFSRVYEMSKGFQVQIKRDKGRNWRLKDAEAAI